MINVKIRYMGKELSTILPKCNDELRADMIRLISYYTRSVVCTTLDSEPLPISRKL